MIELWIILFSYFCLPVFSKLSMYIISVIRKIIKYIIFITSLQNPNWQCIEESDWLNMFLWKSFFPTQVCGDWATWKERVSVPFCVNVSQWTRHWCLHIEWLLIVKLPNIRYYPEARAPAAGTQQLQCIKGHELVHSFNLEIHIMCLLCARHCYRHWEYRDEQDRQRLLAGLLLTF